MLKIKFFLLCICGISLIQLFSCNKENQTKSTLILKSLETFGYGADTLSCQKNCISNLTKQSDTSFIINRLEDYDAFKKYVSCLELTHWPSIDFSKYTMLAGVGILGTTCGTLLPDRFSLNHSDSKYVFNIVIKPGGYEAFSAIFYWTLVDKIDNGSKVEFIIKLEYNK